MKIQFYKYQGAGNDFVVLDNRDSIYDVLSHQQRQWLCDRRFGVGADGLMLLNNHPTADFEMLYYNANGALGSMCGNGGRCMVAFAHFLGLIEQNTNFLAVDGWHEARYSKEEFVELKMGAVSKIALNERGGFIDTGSPHHIEYVEALDQTDVYQLGKAIRNEPRYIEQGVNVNFVEVLKANCLKVGTFERGVEDETLACGTGVTAAAIAYFLQHQQALEGNHHVRIDVKGGHLEVKFNYQNGEFNDIWLLGPAVQVFNGTIELPA